MLFDTWIRNAGSSTPVSGHGFSDFVNNVHIPYWYKRRTRDSSETDYKAEVKPIKGAKHVGRTKDKCPVDGATLDLYSIFSMEFEGCLQCRGMWLVKDELRKLKNKALAGRLHWLNDEIDNVEKTAAVPSERACPNFHGKMLSVVFGKSSIVIDWCPKCHGIWLDRAEFDSILEYLNTEAANATRKDIEKEIVQDLKKLWKGGSESRAAEVADIAAAVVALANVTVFEHPALFRFLTNTSAAGRSVGMD